MLMDWSILNHKASQINLTGFTGCSIFNPELLQMDL